MALWQNVNLANNYMTFQDKMHVILCENNNTTFTMAYYSAYCVNFLKELLITNGIVSSGPPCICHHTFYLPSSLWSATFIVLILNAFLRSPFFLQNTNWAIVGYRFRHWTVWFNCGLMIRKSFFALDYLWHRWMNIFSFLRLSAFIVYDFSCVLDVFVRSYWLCCLSVK